MNVCKSASDKKNPIPEIMRKLLACYRYGLGMSKDSDKEKVLVREDC